MGTPPRHTSSHSAAPKENQPHPCTTSVCTSAGLYQPRQVPGRDPSRAQPQGCTHHTTSACHRSSVCTPPYSCQPHLVPTQRLQLWRSAARVNTPRAPYQQPTHLTPHTRGAACSRLGEHLVVDDAETHLAQPPGGIRVHISWHCVPTISSPGKHQQESQLVKCWAADGGVGYAAHPPQAAQSQE
jgi:hypothetical protein